MSDDREYREADYLRRQYVERRLSTEEIAEQCQVTSSTIHRWLSRHGIDRQERYRDREWLREQYVEQSRSVADIASECGVVESTISYWLGRHEVVDRNTFQTGTCKTCEREFEYYPSVRDGQYCSAACSHEPTKRRVTVTCPNCGTEFERRASLDTEYCSPACWGEDLYDGTERFYTGSWYEQRERALQRDGHRCTVCGITEEEYRAESGRGLDVHHVVPIRLFVRWEVPPADAHDLSNLRTVCRSCHPDAPG